MLIFLVIRGGKKSTRDPDFALGSHLLKVPLFTLYLTVPPQDMAPRRKKLAKIKASTFLSPADVPLPPSPPPSPTSSSSRQITTTTLPPFYRSASDPPLLRSPELSLPLPFELTDAMVNPVECRSKVSALVCKSDSACHFDRGIGLIYDIRTQGNSW